MKNSRKHLIFSIFSLIFVFFTFVFVTFSWMDNTFTLQNDMLGRVRTSLKSYFAGGDGTSTTPFIIAEPEHVSNLAYLQNSGQFEGTQYYFKVADPDTGNRIEIDFTGYPSIPPIGDHTYPFKGTFNGNLSTFTSLAINGYGKQDIGLFGFAEGVDLNSDGDFDDTGEYYSVISNLFVDSPFIISNPTTLDSSPTFHEHNDSIVNRATGYVIGHLGKGATLDNIFIIDSTLDSYTNLDLNRSQYGIIGFNESDNGYVAGSPRNSYSFSLDATSAFSALSSAISNYGSYYVNGGSTTLNTVLKLINSGTQITLAGGSKTLGDIYSYTLSTIKVSTTINDPNPVYLYDLMEQNGFPISYTPPGEDTTYYSRSNIDVVGLVDIQTISGAKRFYYEPMFTKKTVYSPLVGSYWSADSYDHSIILYVKPTSNPNDMGVSQIQGSSGGGWLGFFPSFTGTNGAYVQNKTFNNAPSLTQITIGSDLTLTRSLAFAAVVRDPSPTNPDRLRVVNPDVEFPDYYIFLIGCGNGYVTVERIYFEYLPAFLEESQLSSIQRVDFINELWISDIIADLTDSDPDTDHVFSLVNFGYDLSENQKIKVVSSRLNSGTIEFYVEFDITDGTPMFFDVLNLSEIPIIIYVKNTAGVYEQKYSGSNQIIASTLTIVSGQRVVSVTAYNNTT